MTELQGHEDRLEISADSGVFVRSRAEGSHGRSRVGGSAPALCQRARCYQSHPWDLLIRELQHRVKNTLATVQALLRATSRSASTVEDFRQVFEARVLSLSRTHNLLVETTWRTASLRNVLHGELGPYDDRAGTRVLLSGPAVELSAELALPTWIRH